MRDILLATSLVAFGLGLGLIMVDMFPTFHSFVGYFHG